MKLHTNIRSKVSCLLPKTCLHAWWCVSLVSIYLFIFALFHHLKIFLIYGYFDYDASSLLHLPGWFDRNNDILISVFFLCTTLWKKTFNLKKVAGNVKPISTLSMIFVLDYIFAIHELNKVVVIHVKIMLCCTSNLSLFWISVYQWGWCSIPIWCNFLLVICCETWEAIQMQKRHYDSPNFIIGPLNF